MGKKGPLWWRESDWLLRGSSAANQILLRHSGPILSSGKSWIRYCTRLQRTERFLYVTTASKFSPHQTQIHKVKLFVFHSTVILQTHPLRPFRMKFVTVLCRYYFHDVNKNSRCFHCFPLFYGST